MKNLFFTEFYKWRIKLKPALLSIIKLRKENKGEEIKIFN